MRGDYSDYQESDNANPEDYLRQQIMGQLQPETPAAVPDPVYAAPETPQPFDSGPSQPAAPQQSSNQGITDPGVRNLDPTPAASDPYATLPANYSTVRQDYQTLLGRDPENIGVVASWLNGTHGDMGQLFNGISASPEAQAYAAAHPAPGGDTFGGGPPSTAPTTAPVGGRPTGGSLTDPGFAAAYVTWAGTQPGVNPSVKNDPGYWIGRFTSGAFGNDQQYALQRMMQAEGAPEAGRAPTVNGPSPTGYSAPQIQAPSAGPSFSSISGGNSNGPQGVWNSDFVAQLRQLLMSRLASASTPVDPNSPTITAPLNAARDEATRSSDKERTALAENLYAQGGLNTDAISQKVQQSGEKNAAGLSSLRATLITREMAQKQDELKSLLQMALQSGDAESAQAIQLQLGELSAQVQREGLGNDLAKYSAYLNALASQQVMN